MAKTADKPVEKKKPKKERRFHPIRYIREMIGELVHKEMGKDGK